MPSYSGPNRASAVSRLLKSAGYTPLPSESTLDGRLTVRASGDDVRITVDLTTARNSAVGMVEDIRALLASHGYRLTETKIENETLADGSPTSWATFYVERPGWAGRDYTRSRDRDTLAYELTHREPVTAPVHQALTHGDAHALADLLDALAALTPGEKLGAVAADFSKRLRTYRETD